MSKITPENCPLWRSAAQSVRGVAHLENGLPCQDSYSRLITKTGRLVIALSDGAGSAKHAERGSQAAATVFCDLLAELDCDLKDVSEEQGLALGRAVASKLTEISVELKCNLEDLSCTLLAAAFQGNEMYFWQVGDGAWIVETKSGIECATWPYKGDFNNETIFITSNNWEDKWFHAVYENGIAAMGFTDGLEMFCLDSASKKPHPPFVDRIFSVLKEFPEEEEISSKIKEMLTSKFIIEREDDDLTCVLAWADDAD